MASASQLKALLQSHIEGDEQQFFSVAMQLAAHEAKLGHGQLAEALRALIDDAKRSVGGSRNAGIQAVPISRPRGDLAGLKNVLVKPENMASMLEDILKRNGKLRLISLNTLPVSSLIPAASEEIKNPLEKIAAAAPSTTVIATSQSGTGTGDIYKHGVEIVVQGKYLDMMSYMVALEAMPWQLYWGRAKMHVETYPEATLSLTLFTLSLDKKWLNL